MPDVFPNIYVLLGLMIVGAIIAVESRDLLSSVISIGAVGFFLSVIYLMLGAPDLALVQVVVEVLALVILIRATITRDDTTYDTHRDAFAVGSGLVFAGAFLVASYFCLRTLHAFGEPVMTVSQQYLNQGLERTGAANYVTGILLDFRAYDTLGEATVIFVAVIGAYVVLRKRGRKSS